MNKRTVELLVPLPANFAFGLDANTAIIPRCPLVPGEYTVFEYEGTKGIPMLFDVWANTDCYVVFCNVSLTVFATGLHAILPSWQLTANHSIHFSSSLVYKNRDMIIHHAPNRISTLSLPGLHSSLEDPLTQL